jgi:hypothetical protein
MDGKSMVFDVRNKEDQLVRYSKLDLASWGLSEIPSTKTSWWTNMEVFTDHLIISEYQDSHDPNNVKYFEIIGNEKLELDTSVVFDNPNKVIHPFLYEIDSDYFKIVREYLNVDLQGPCEYLEFGNRIILSHYLRSSNGFSRHLLVIEEGKRLLDIVLDSNMKGFASGAFFVVSSKLCFIKNRNEINIYSL